MKTIPLWWAGTACALTTLLPTALHAQAPSLPTLGQEQIAPDEADQIRQIDDLVLQILKQENPPGTKIVHRDAHPKMHGLVRAQFIVLDDLPANLRYGVFKAPHTYDAWIRFSASSATIQPDTTPDGHGMAIKLMGVPGEKLLEPEKNETTQDFIMINYPGFIVRNLPDYIALQKAIAAGNPGTFFGSHPTEAQAGFALTHQVFHNPLQVRYWSQTPYRLGPPQQAAKYSVRPITLQQNAPSAMPGPTYLTEAMAAQLADGDAYFEFMVQVQTDPAAMPIEDSVVIWDEKASPFQRVALIRIPKQTFTSAAQVTFGENLSFTPWHSLPEHQPLGNMNRTRRVVYETLSKYRHERNHAPRREPTGKEQFAKESNSKQ